MPPAAKTFQQERYRIVHQFGQDENFALYEAYDNALKINVVLKEVKNNQQSPALQGKIEMDFAAEVKLLTRIRHEHLLSIHDYFSEVDNHYLVMELTDGSNLIEAIEKNQKPFSISEVARWADQLLDALSWLHKHEPPIIHHRIAPQNLVLTANGKIKLLFSGSDKNLGAMPGGKLLNFLNTDFETVSFNYLPLEQIWEGLDPASQKVILNSYDDRAVRVLESPADARSDLYSLAATLYFALTGQAPTDALARSIDLLDGKDDPLVAPHKLNPSISPEISNVLMRAMEIRRENRYDSATFMRQILRTAFAKTNPPAPKFVEAPGNKVSSPSPNLPDHQSAEQKRLEEERQAIERNRLKIEAEQKRLEEERKIIQQKQLELEAAQKKQQELAAEQLRQAEELRLQAEQRAAEAEKKLLEKEISARDSIAAEAFPAENSEDSKLTAADSSAQDSQIESFDEPENADKNASPVFEISENTSSTDSTEDLFAVPPQNNTFKYLAVAAVILLICGGAGWAIWSNFASKNISSSESANSLTISDAEKPSSVANQAVAPPTPAPTVETISESNSEATPTTISTETPTITENPSLPKTRVATPARRPAASPVVKPTVAPKKSVTVDDIINDN